jgi:hypothetical protein
LLGLGAVLLVIAIAIFLCVGASKAVDWGEQEMFSIIEI